LPISYAPMWKTMKEKGFTTYTLKHKVKIGGGTYENLKNDRYVSTHTIDKLCEYFDCEVQDIMCRVRNKGL
jgi:DNA-binding Xre family transcriptional regulator